MAKERWNLAASVKAPGGSSLEIQRVLSPEEAHGALRALDLINRLTSSSEWNTLLGAWRSVESQLDRTPSPENVRVLDGLVFRLLHALRRFGLWAAEIQADESDTLARAKNLNPSPDWTKITESLGQLPDVPFRCVEVIDLILKPGQVRNAVALSAAASSYLSLEIEQRFQPRIWLETAATLAERVHSSLLRALDVDIRSSAIVLQRLGAEVLLGTTNLVKGLNFEASPGGRNIQPTIREIPLDHIPRLIFALRNAMKLPIDVPEQDGKVALKSNQGSAGGNDRLNDSSIAPADVPEAPISARPQSGIDPVGLHAETNRMSEKLERLWTKSLERVLTDEVLADELSRWQTLLASSSASMLGKGEGKILPQFPLSAEDVAGFIASDSEDHGSIAHLYAVVLLAEAIQDFNKPRIVVDASAGTLEPWWNSGGFARLRDAGDLLLLSILEMGQAQHSDLVIPQNLTPLPERATLVLAERCLQAGAPEASLTYLLQAWKESETARVNESYPQGAKDAISAFTLLLPGVKETALRFGRGERIPLRVSLPLAFTGVNALKQIIGPRVVLQFRNAQ